MTSEDRIKLLEQNITSFKRRLSSASNKDELRRSIAACEAKIKELRT